MKKKILSPVCASLLILLMALPASTELLPYSQDLLFELDSVFSIDNTSPNGTSPWLTATFVDLAPQIVPGIGQRYGVRLIFDTAGLSQGPQFVNRTHLNIDNSIDALEPSFTSTSGAFANVSQSNNLFKAGTDGYFDILFEFSSVPGGNTDLFNGGEKSTFDIWSSQPISALAFNSLSDPRNDPSVKTLFYSAALIGGIGQDGAWIGATQSKLPPGPGPGPSPVPEPATMILLGLGLGGLTVFGRKKFFA
jgi:hypothetical protein